MELQLEGILGNMFHQGALFSLHKYLQVWDTKDFQNEITKGSMHALDVKIKSGYFSVAEDQGMLPKDKITHCTINSNTFIHIYTKRFNLQWLNQLKVRVEGYIDEGYI